MERRNSWFDAIRGFAILAVMLRHAFNPIFPMAGVLGVNAFFVLSGFLISGIFQRHLEGAGRMDLGVFYRNRAVRLIPALSLFLACWSIYEFLFAKGPVVPLLVSVLIALTYTANLHLPIDPNLGHLWTLATEEQFYLVWPVFYFLVSKLRLKLVKSHLALLATSYILLVALAAALAQFGHVKALYPLGITWISSILVGVIFRLSQNHIYAFLLKSKFHLGFTSVLLALTAFIPLDKDQAWVYLLYAPIAAIVVGLIVVFVSRKTGTSGNEHFVLRSSAKLGEISYAAYLWNLPVSVICNQGLGWVGSLLSIALTLLFAYGSLVLVEKPFRELKRSY